MNPLYSVFYLRLTPLLAQLGFERDNSRFDPFITNDLGYMLCFRECGGKHEHYYAMLRSGSGGRPYFTTDVYAATSYEKLFKDIVEQLRALDYDPAHIYHRKRMLTLLVE